MGSPEDENGPRQMPQRLTPWVRPRLEPEERSSRPSGGSGTPILSVSAWYALLRSKTI
jgi:hypothetical protein